MTDKEQIVQIVKYLLFAMDFEIEPTMREVIRDGDEIAECVCVIKTEEYSQFLIGHHGKNLAALEQLSRSIAHQKGVSMRFRIDINDYREGKKVMLERIALDARDEALRNKKPSILRPMNPYERRIIHTKLADDSRITTDSIGEGADRKVVVKPESIIASL